MRLNFRPFQIKRKEEQEKIYDQCHRKLYFTAFRILNNQFEAEEVMHDTLLKFFMLEEEFASIKERDRWMSRVCVNLSIDLIRKRRVESSKLEVIEAEQAIECSTQIESLEQTSLHGVTPEMIKAAINNLSQGYRTVLSLNLFEGYDYQEISQILKIKEVSVRTQFIRGRASLIAQLEKLKKKQPVNYGTS